MRRTVRTRQPRSARALPRLRARVADNIKHRRHGAGLSQERLGAQAGVSGKFIGEVKRREKSISVDSLGHVARALGVELVELLVTR